MGKLETFPVRRVVALLVAACSTYLAFANHYYTIVNQEVYALDWGMPPPPLGTFIQAALAFPGLLAGSPLIIAGSRFGAEWLAQLGMVLGASFFWYGVGWHMDRERGLITAENPPWVIRTYMSVLIVASVITFPFGVLAGLRLGDHGWGAPPFWSAVLGYGIFMAWISLGVFFAWRRFRQWRRREAPSIFSSES